MADTGLKSPTSTGSPLNQWTNPTNAYTSNNIYATLSETTFSFGEVAVDLSYDAGINYTSTKIVILDTTENTYTLGGSLDTWGRSWSDTELNDTNFRLRISGVDISSKQDYATFGFGLPPGATIDGILVTVEGKKAAGKVGITLSVDHLQIKIYYTEAPSGAIKDVIGLGIIPFVR